MNFPPVLLACLVEDFSEDFQCKDVLRWTITAEDKGRYLAFTENTSPGPLPAKPILDPPIVDPGLAETQLSASDAAAFAAIAELLTNGKDDQV